MNSLIIYLEFKKCLLKSYKRQEMEILMRKNSVLNEVVLQKNKCKKGVNGITLIALIITIIVLLILARSNNFCNYWK